MKETLKEQTESNYKYKNEKTQALCVSTGFISNDRCGLAKLGTEYSETDEKRISMRLFLDGEDVDSKHLKNMFIAIDEYFGSPEGKTALFGPDFDLPVPKTGRNKNNTPAKHHDKYSYISCIKLNSEKTNEKTKEVYPAFEAVNVKFKVDKNQNNKFFNWLLH